MYGPRHPGQPVSETEVVSPSVIAQDYADGRLYNISAPRGRSFLAVVRGLSIIPDKDMDRADLVGVYDPVQEPDYDGLDKNVYFSLWVPIR